MRSGTDVAGFAPGGAHSLPRFRLVLAAALWLIAIVAVVPAFAEVLTLSDSGNLVEYRGQAGAVGQWQVTGTIDGRVFGTRVYTDDSDVGTAAVHAGVLAPGETRTLTIKLLNGKAGYAGSSSHGVTTEDFGSWFGSYEFLDPPEKQKNANAQPDPGNLVGYRGQVGHTLNFVVTGTTGGSLYGDGTYTDDSQLSTAAVYAGLLAPGETGTVAVTILPGQQHYVGATRFNIYSSDYGAWQGSFRFAALPALPSDAIPDPGDMTQYRGRNGQVFQFAVTGLAQGTVYGDGVYTDDTHIAVAAVHAGLLRDGEVGLVNVQILPGQDTYGTATRNGVTSLGYSHWAGSYQFVQAN